MQGGDLVVAGVLSGNRNFTGRVNPHTRANYLASPPLVVAYALAGTVDIDFERDPIGRRADGAPVFLRDIWPRDAEVKAHLGLAMDPAGYHAEYEGIEDANEAWNAIEVEGGTVYAWDEDSTYIQEPPFFKQVGTERPGLGAIEGARALFFGGDSVTTDHISPAGVIPASGPAGRYLVARGVEADAFNSFGSRRGNDRVMVRGTFGNIRLQNRLGQGQEGGVTTHLPSGELLSIFGAARRYQREAVPVIALAGHDYGMGSSRDWAAKGTLLLGVRAVIAESFERIHRANLIGMGVLPLQFLPGQGPDDLSLTGRERFTIALEGAPAPRSRVGVLAVSDEGVEIRFEVLAHVDTPMEAEILTHGGVLHMVLREMLKDA